MLFTAKQLPIFRGKIKHANPNWFMPECLRNDQFESFFLKGFAGHISNWLLATSLKQIAEFFWFVLRKVLIFNNIRASLAEVSRSKAFKWVRTLIFDHNLKILGRCFLAKNLYDWNKNMIFECLFAYVQQKGYFRINWNWRPI